MTTWMMILMTIILMLSGNAQGYLNHLLYDIDSNNPMDESWPNTENGGNKSSCKLYVDRLSTEFFRNVILTKGYNMMHLRLIFSDLTVDETKYVIGKDHWVWTYKGHDGGHRYLYLPNDYSYLSFGILITHSLTKEYYLNLTHTGNCSGLKVGTPKTDHLIGQAFGEVTSGIAQRYDKYNHSYWCYTRRLWLVSDFLYWACKNSVCTLQTFEYRCCKYTIHFPSRRRHVECPTEHYLFAEIWWMFPIIVGEICFAFYPLLLAKIGSSVQKLARSIERRRRQFLNFNFEQKRVEEDSLEEDLDVRPLANVNYVNLKYGNPVSFMSTICSPLLYIKLNGPITKRVLRAAIIFLPMSLTFTRVFLDYTFAPHLVKEAVVKGALVGFSSMLTGYKLSRHKFLYIFGGPFIALSIYIIFGCITLSVPSDLGKTLQRGLFLPTGPSTFLLSISIERRERFSRVYFQNIHGYKKMYHYLKASYCMLLNTKFWKYTLRLFVSRWRSDFHRCLLKRLKIRLLIWALMLLSLPVYMSFCIIELLFSLLYFAFPVISTFFLLFKAFALEYFTNLTLSGSCWQFCRIVIFIPLSVCFFITWYMYCIIFFDGFWFLSKLAMFTYSGIIAYPKLSYGYLILTFMAVYYLVESINKFGESYKSLLKIATDACQRIEIRKCKEGVPVSILHKKGLPLEIFSYIVERHLPIRNQLVTTLFRFVSILTILCISIELLRRFDKVEDISLVSHVFTVLFICALPKIIRMMFVEGHEYKTRKKLRHKVETTIEGLLRMDQSSESDDQDEPFVEREGYQRLEQP